MCARYSFVPTVEQFETLIDRMGRTPEPRVNIAPATDCLVRSATGVDRFRWGLVPPWADDPKIGTKMINARSETVVEKPAFRAAFRHRRCLVPATSFFEWQHGTAMASRVDDRRREGQSSLFDDPAEPVVATPTKRPFAIRHRHGELLWMAGLWEEWRGGSDPLRTFTILTTAPNATMAPLHDRMPVFLGPEDHAMWLDPDFARTDVLRSLLLPAADDLLTAYPVTPKVGNPRYQEPDALAPLAEPGE